MNRRQTTLLSLSHSPRLLSSTSQLPYTSNGEFHQDADESMGSPPPETRFGAQVPSLVSGGVNFFFCLGVLRIIIVTIDLIAYFAA